MLPGLGYDCFRSVRVSLSPFLSSRLDRNWEMLTMGTIGIIERGVGFDRTVTSPTLSSQT
jgi:hypothetical protein